jgi:UrcA family protein
MIRHTSTQTRGRARAAVAAVAGCLFAVAMGAARATPSDSPPTVRVSYADLDLTTEQGVRVLYARIVSAADLVCPYAGIENLSLYVRSRACRKQAIAEAVQHVGNPRLAALSAEHTGHG